MLLPPPSLQSLTLLLPCLPHMPWHACNRWIFQQIILAVDYCHRKGVGHRDLKLENTLLEMVPGLPRPLVKICDFGYSKQDSRSVARSKVSSSRSRAWRHRVLYWEVPRWRQGGVFTGQ
jgi:hypothetical protein